MLDAKIGCPLLQFAFDDGRGWENRMEMEVQLLSKCADIVKLAIRAFHCGLFATLVRKEDLLNGVKIFCHVDMYVEVFVLLG